MAIADIVEQRSEESIRFFANSSRRSCSGDINHPQDSGFSSCGLRLFSVFLFAGLFSPPSRSPISDILFHSGTKCSACPLLLELRFKLSEAAQACPSFVKTEN